MAAPADAADPPPATGGHVPPSTAWLFPGQGSQSVGMARDLLAGFPPARGLLEMASELAGSDLGALMARGPEALLARTDLLQPALTVVNLGCCGLLREAGFEPDAVAGHSLGEFSALYAAGVLDAATTLRLVVRRGALMQEVAAGLDAGMLAVKGATLAELQGLLDDVQADERTGVPVVVANINATLQMALAGPRESLERVRERVAQAGFGSVALNVSGPWHSPMLRPAAERFAELLAQVPFDDARVPVFNNVDAQPHRTAPSLRQQAVAQMCRPVQWSASLLALHQAGVRRFIEVGPGKVLRGLLRGTAETASSVVANVDGPKSLRFLEGWR